MTVVYKDGYAQVRYKKAEFENLPKGVPINSMAVELDSGDVYYYDVGGIWEPFGGEEE